MTGLPPGARLNIDGKVVSAERLVLTAGPHAYTISATGFRTETGRVLVAANAVTMIDGALQRSAEAVASVVAPANRASAAAPIVQAAAGKIRVRADPPDADIFIDDRSVGRGVLVDFELPAGIRRMRISASGYVAFDTLITVGSGETTSLGRRTLRSAQ